MSTRSEVEAALRAYVRGRDRVWEHSRKRGPGPTTETEVEFGSVPTPPRFGVGVAEHLDFSNGPAAWRDRGGRKTA